MSLHEPVPVDAGAGTPAPSPFHAELARVFSALDVPIFGVAGDSNLFFVDSLVEREARYIAATHEGGAVLMAAGYASVSDRVGVATITQGAITNAVTALADATRSRLPVVLLAGETPAWDLDNVQCVPTGRIARSSGAEYLRLEQPDDADDVLALAFRRARRSAVPVVVGIPSDLMHEGCSLSAIPAVRRPAVPPAPEAAVRAAALLADAQRPLILAGRGAIHEEARAGLLSLARRTGARLATTLRAKDLFRGEPADLGIFGGLAREGSQAYFAAADVLLAVGAGLNSYTTSQGAGTRGKRLVQVDVDPARARADMFVQGSAAATAQTLLESLVRYGVDRDRPHWELDGGPSRTAPTPVADGRRPMDTIDYVEVLERLDAVLPADRLLTVDGGRMFFEAVRRLSVASPRDYVHTMSMGSIGMGLGLAIGASLAEPARLSVLVSGDGGFMLGGLSEFATAVRQRLKLLVLVMNDGCYGAEHHHFTARGQDPRISYFEWPDFAPVARALGGQGIEVRRPEDLERVVHALEGASWPVLVDVKLDPERISMDFSRTPPGAGVAP